MIDKTGLTDRYDFTLTFSDGSSDSPGTVVIDAVREQLGLDLQETKLSLPRVVVDFVEDHPTDN